MKNPNSEIRNPNVGWPRSVLDYDDSSTLSSHAAPLLISKRRQFGALRMLVRTGLLLLLWFAACLSLPAQSYSIDWFTIDGGGGTSTGGVYSVSGTIGQPDAGAMSGGNFTLVGGFWGVVAAVQTEGAPWLTVTRSNSAVIVSWSAPASGWLLHSTTNFITGGSKWMEIAPPYQTNSTNLQFTEPSPAGNKFYRLHKP